MTPEQILVALNNTIHRPRNVAPQVKVALDYEKTKPLQETGAFDSFSGLSATDQCCCDE